MKPVITIPTHPTELPVPLPAVCKVTAAQAKQILKENGLQVTIAQAAAITMFLYTLANNTTTQS